MWDTPICIVRGEKRALENQLLSQLDICCPNISRDAVWFEPVHSAVSDLQAVLHHCRYTVVAILLGLPADMVTVLVCLNVRRLTFSGAVWLLTVTVELEERLAGSSTMASPSNLIKCFLGKVVVMFWQRDDFELLEGTASPTLDRGKRPQRLEQ